MSVKGAPGQCIASWLFQIQAPIPHRTLFLVKHLRPGRDKEVDKLQTYFNNLFNENIWNFNEISLRFVPESLVQVICLASKPLLETIMTQFDDAFITHAPLFRGGEDHVWESPLGDSCFVMNIHNSFMHCMTSQYVFKLRDVIMLMRAVKIVAA